LDAHQAGHALPAALQEDCVGGAGEVVWEYGWQG